MCCPPSLPAVGRCAVKGRSAVRCTGWRTATCGAPPAAGKRPARDSPTERFPANVAARHANRHCCLLPENGGRGFILHAFGFLQLKVATVHQAPAPPLSSLPPQLHGNHSSCGRNQRTAESPFPSPSRIPSTASPFPLFPGLGNPSAAKQCKEKIDPQISPVFYVWFRVASFYVL